MMEFMYHVVLSVIVVVITQEALSFIGRKYITHGVVKVEHTNDPGNIYTVAIIVIGRLNLQFGRRQKADNLIRLFIMKKES